MGQAWRRLCHNKVFASGSPNPGGFAVFDMSRRSSVKSANDQMKGVLAINDDSNDGVKQKSKLLGVFVAPVVAMVLMAAVQMTFTARTMSSVSVSSSTIDSHKVMNELITEIIQERTLVVGYVGSGGYNIEFLGQLDLVRDAVNSLIEEVTAIDPGTSAFLTTVSHQGRSWAAARLCTPPGCTLQVSDIMRAYADVIRQLLTGAHTVVEIPQQSKEDAMWSMFIAASALTRLVNIVGQRQILVVLAWTMCHVSPENNRLYSLSSGERDTFLRLSFNYYRYTEAQLKQLSNNSAILFDDPKYSSYNETVDVTSCMLLRDVPFEQFMKIRQVMLLYRDIIDVIVIVRDEVLQRIDNELDAIYSTNLEALVSYSVVYGTISLACLVVSVWYSSKLQAMITDMRESAGRINEKTNALQSEKKRTEYLLSQMLPETVVHKFIAGQDIPPEFFDKVTIYFSDIVGFEDLSTRSSPHEIVQMLNALYVLFDEAIDRYNVYKVETIRDSYMVVSGLPEEYPRHADEVAHMAMELIVSVRAFVIPHLPGEILQLRIGMHTGPCVAGVVGVKMPRYCLFGDCVNTASRMETNSRAGKIHLSSDMRDALLAQDMYYFEDRGPLEVKGKGVMDTYFLVGCSHLANIDNVDLNTYMRLHRYNTESRIPSATDVRLKED